MKPINRFNYWGRILLLLCIISSMSSSAQELKNDTTVPSPWIVHAANFFIYGFQIEVAKIQEFLPEGIVAKTNDQGLVSGALEMYETDRIYGIPNYKTVFVFIETIGYDSTNGTPGHFIIGGYMKPASNTIMFTKQYGFPFTYDTEIHVAVNGRTHTGSVGVLGKELIKIKVERTKDTYDVSEGIVNVIGKKEDTLLYTSVPWMSTGCIGKVTHLEINPQGNPVLEVIKDLQPLWAFVNVDQYFTYTPPRLTIK